MIQKSLGKKIGLAISGIALLLILTASNVVAYPILTIEDGYGVVTTINDADNDGIVTYFSTSGDTIFSGGTSYPELGVSDFPIIHFSAYLGNASAYTPFTFTLTDTFTDLAAYVGGWSTTFSSAPIGVSSFKAYIDGIEIASFTDAGIQYSSYLPTNTNDYTITLTGTLNAVGSYDAHLTAVPEPGTLMLLGSGLFGLVGLAYRRKKK